MSDEEQDILTGREGVEASQGWSPMVSADPVSNPDDIAIDGTMSESELARAKRPAEADWGELTEREYYTATGEPTPERQSVSPEQAGKDLANVREQERQAREDLAAQDLQSALDQTEQPQPPAQDQQPAALDEIQPEAMDPDVARADADAKWAEADKAIESLLQEPYARERIEQSFNHIKEEAKAEVERAHNLSAAVQQHYATATNNLVGEANALLGVLYPELNGLNPEQIKGALTVMAQQNPQRVQALQQLASRAAGLVEAQARQQHQAQQGLELQRNHAMEQFTVQADKAFEEATKYESPELMKQVRSRVYDVAEKAYGLNKQTLNALYSGEQRIDSAALIRSTPFQLILKDAVAYRLSREGITQARSNPIPKVQRPGVASDGPRVHDGDLAAAASRFNLPGGNEGTQGLRNAAAWVTAKRGAR